MTVPDFLIWRCAGCGAAAEGKKKPCVCTTNVGTRKGPSGAQEQTWWDDLAPCETGWVIEHHDSEPSRPLYFSGVRWDYDNLKAVRFAREQDAQTMCRYLFPGEPHRIAEHEWG